MGMGMGLDLFDSSCSSVSFLWDSRFLGGLGDGGDDITIPTGSK